MRSLATLLLLLVAGCVRVKPWQRERLAKPAMETRFGQSGSAHAPGRLCRFVVCAWIPELALASGFGDDWLASARYRFYKQSATHFYEARYANIELLMTGDARLGPIEAHTVGAAVRWRLEPVTVVGSYDLSLLVRRDLPRPDGAGDERHRAVLGAHRGRTGAGGAHDLPDRWRLEEGTRAFLEAVPNLTVEKPSEAGRVLEEVSQRLT